MSDLTIVLELIIMTILFVVSIGMFAKIERKIFLLITVMTAIICNVISLGSGIPFTPYVQLFYSVMEVTMLILSVAR